MKAQLKRRLGAPPDCAGVFIEAKREADRRDLRRMSVDVATCLNGYDQAAYQGGNHVCLAFVGERCWELIRRLQPLACNATDRRVPLRVRQTGVSH